MPTRLPLDLPTPDGWNAFSPSIAADPAGGYRMLVRVANYRLTPDLQYVVDDGIMRSRADLVRLTDDFAVDSVTPLADAPIPGRTLCREDGYEDCRLFHWGGDRWGAVGATRAWNDRGLCETVLMTVTDDAFADPVVISGPLIRHEKNWMPVTPCGSDDLQCVVQCAPVVVAGRHRGHPYTISRAPIGSSRAKRFRGGSQLIPFDGGHLAIVHEIGLSMDGRRIYDHRWAWFGPSFDLAMYSPPFSFSGQPIEFCAGLAPCGGDELVASYGVWDRECWLAVYHVDDVRDALETAPKEIMLR